MYAYIEGKIVEKNPTYVVLDVNGMGYNIHISLHTYSQMEGRNNFRMYTHMAIKNEATTPVGFVLYGFADEKERELFRHLISVSRVGANTALLMLSSLHPNEIYSAIVNENVDMLQSIKGIGSKAAQRIIVDLKDKLEKEVPVSEKLSVKHNTQKIEALSALTMLGFNKVPAAKVVDKILASSEEDLSVEVLIKQALKVL
ncbi:MAG: Holliday junction branch migration protein RuvA [Bacteroidales bacterium]|nr:Holliday junction branch migration protein RuvA [Bacteroidales bacterium]